jgi:hypothetical protein
MRRSIPAVDWARAAVCAGIVLVVAQTQAQPGPAITQSPVWVAVAVSQSTGNYGAAASQMALKYCAMYGAKDCIIVHSDWNDCVALATFAKPVAKGDDSSWGKSPNRAAAAAEALVPRQGVARCGSRPATPMTRAGLRRCRCRQRAFSRDRSIATSWDIGRLTLKVGCGSCRSRPTAPIHSTVPPRPPPATSRCTTARSRRATATTRCAL